MFCTKCGTKLEDGAIKCPNCNNVVDGKIDMDNIKEKLAGFGNATKDAFTSLAESSKEVSRASRESFEEKKIMREMNKNTSATENTQYSGGSPYIQNYNPKYDYTPIGMWGYFIYTILFNIPVVGFILTVIFAFGAGRNINLRNFARSYFCLSIIVLVILLIAIIGGGF